MSNEIGIKTSVRQIIGLLQKNLSGREISGVPGIPPPPLEAEKNPSAFDIRRGICYNKSTKRGTADRRSASA